MTKARRRKGQPKDVQTMKSLYQRLRELDDMRNPHRRGRLFEPFISQILEEEGFNVSLNPKSATPRQTDLFASREGQSFLVDAKWLRNPAHVGHVSAVRERLRKCPPDMFGCMFSMSGYTASAIQEVCRDRSPEILLFRENEIRGIASSAMTFEELLTRKKEEIRRGSVAWFSDEAPDRTKTSHLCAESKVIQINKQTRAWAFSGTRDHDVLFALEILDLSGMHQNSVFSLHLRLDIYTLADLHRLIRILKKHLDLEGIDSFAIRQRNAGWHGLGDEEFLSSVQNWRSRYNELGWSSYHHSEELAYFDRLSDGGLMCLTSRQRVGEQAYLHSSYLEVLLSGVPVDTSAIRRLCELTKNPDAKLENVDKNPVENIQFHPPIPVETIGTIVCEDDDEKLVTGLVAKNPFFGEGVPVKEGQRLGDPLRFLSESEYLLCSMSQWHGADDRKYEHVIRYAEACWIGHVPVLHIACDWRDKS